MGIGFVVVFWLVAGTICAVLSGSLMGRFTARLLPQNSPDRSHVARIARRLPFACLAWVAIVFVAQAIVNEEFFHRDIGLGDSWHSPLPNGYEISFVDVTDQGTVYNPTLLTGSDASAGRKEGVSGVRVLQVSGPLLFGGADTQSLQHADGFNQTIDSYFVLDTRKGMLTPESDLKALTKEASRLGVSLHMEPIYTVYACYRFTWFDITAGLVAVVFPLVALVVLAGWIIRLRKMQHLYSDSVRIA